MEFIKWFDQIGIADIAQVGGKNASLGQMVTNLAADGVRVPYGFAITADAYRHFIRANDLEHKINDLLATVTDPENIDQLHKAGQAIRALIEQAKMPQDLADAIIKAYLQLCNHYKKPDLDVAVRSSATAEDLPNASFAGQQETFLHVHGSRALLSYCQKGYASLFTDRAISYRIQQGFAQTSIALSLGIQKMVRSDLACSGVGFSLDTESGFKDAIIINSSYGLGEAIVQGLVTPDEFWVHKPTLQKGYAPIIKKRLGEKLIKMVYDTAQGGLIKQEAVSESSSDKFSLTDEEILELARFILSIERHYSTLKGAWSPMDVEWAKDGIDGKLYIVQARPETIFGSQKNNHGITLYRLKSNGHQPFASGQSIGKKIVSGPARVVLSAANIDQVRPGDILITRMTDPDWVPVMKKAAGIITAQGGRTCHAAIVARELGIPAIIGVANALELIKPDMPLTLDCSQGSVGFIYEGTLDFTRTDIALTGLPQMPTKVMLNLADPDGAFSASFLPVQGVGLARMEFIITSAIKIHPLALVHPEKINDPGIRAHIDLLTVAYQDKKQFFVDTLAEGIGSIAAAFYPRPVIVRLSDFKTNEYRNLIGGAAFEPQEENPMIGWRGASRYYDPGYKEAFALECQALKKVRETMGLTNVKIMVPFVRTTSEAAKVIGVLKENGIERGQNGLELVMMVEIPSNVILIDQFSAYFDGFSIGSNDLTQLTLGVDRDSQDVAELFDERNEAMTRMFKIAIAGAHEQNKFIGICGQAPSDYPEIAGLLIKLGIDSLSLNPDSVIPFLMRQG